MAGERSLGQIVAYPVAPDTVTVLGNCYKATCPAWRGLDFAHKKVRLRYKSTLMMYVCGYENAPFDLHLDVPWWHPEDGPPPCEPEMYYRVRPRARAGSQWHNRTVRFVKIERDPRISPPWKIIITWAGEAPPKIRHRELASEPAAADGRRQRG